MGAGKGNAQVLLIIYVACRAAARGLSQQGFNLRFGERCARDGLNLCGHFVLAEQLHGSPAVPANGLEQVKSLHTFGLEAGRNSSTNGFAVGQQVVEEVSDAISLKCDIAGKGQGQ